MRFEPPLAEARFLARYKRFFADVALPSGAVLTAHCPNTGAMMGLDLPGARAWISASDNPKRKLRHTLEAIEADGVAVGINTGRPNRLAEEAIRAGRIAEFADVAAIRREVRYGANSRVDLVLEHGGEARPTYVEIKNVHLSRRAGLAEFPDSATARGVKHLGELAAMAAAGTRAVMLYIVQRPDAARFAIAADLDPAYAAAVAAARAAGVEMLAYACRVSPEEIAVSHRLDMI
jgi:sugar fermentation stimulation protein A